MNAKKQNDENKTPGRSAEISDADVVEAMKEIGGYLDITPGDLKEVLRIAHLQAVKRIAGSVRARDIMTTVVHTVREDTPLSAVAELMAAQKISGVPVLDREGKVAGIISERDFLSHLGTEQSSSVMEMVAGLMKGQQCPAAGLRSQTAADIMSSPGITVAETATIFELMELFAARKINRAPVVDAENRLKGIVSRNDIVKSPLSDLR